MLGRCEAFGVVETAEVFVCQSLVPFCDNPPLLLHTLLRVLSIALVHRPKAQISGVSKLTAEVSSFLAVTDF
jgi:hypothetical protein